MNNLEVTYPKDTQVNPPVEVEVKVGLGLWPGDKEATVVNETSMSVQDVRKVESGLPMDWKERRVTV